MQERKPLFNAQLDQKPFINKHERLKRFLEEETISEQETEEQQRKRLGYSKNQWLKIRVCQRAMNLKLIALLEPYLVDSVNIGGDITTEEQDLLFNRYNILWKNFVRENIIKNWPGAKTNQKVRMNLLEVFEKRVDKIQTTALKNLLKPGEPGV